jgi:hypothetical protein
MLGLCRTDTVIDTLRNVFHANIVAVPEARIRPLIVIAASKDQTSFRGQILPLLKKPTAYTDPVIRQSGMPAVTGTKTRQVSADFGLQILGNFLQGFGVPSAGIDAAFSGASSVSFSFSNVIRFFVDVNELGEHLVNSVLDRDNPGSEVFFRDKNPLKCCIVDSAITSSDFTLSVEKANSENFQLDVPMISEIVSKGKGGVKVSSSSKLAITFQGDKQLGFAFSCLHATFYPDGRIASLEPGGDIPRLEALTGDFVVSHTPDHVLLSRDPAMLLADFSEFAG